MILRLELRGILCFAAFAVAESVNCQDIAIANVDLYAVPGEAPISGATIIIIDGRVATVGANLDTQGLRVLDGEGRTVSAGLWNSHVHLSDATLADDPGAVLGAMLLRYGFTSVVDTGSILSDTLRLAARISAHDFPGPRIVTASGGLVFTDGTPSYLLPDTRLPEVATSEAAAPIVNDVLDGGADGIKIFSGSFKSRAETVVMPPDVIRAITATAHARGRFVVAHPTNRQGLANAVYNGVDVLAHTAPPAGPLGLELTRRMVGSNVALIPTLKLWSWELARNGVPPAQISSFQNAGVAQLREYFLAGGEILFGTDVGYMRDFDTTEEFEMMHRAGLRFHDVLAALTTNPSKRFAGESGTVEPGAPGDVVIFRSSPSSDVTAFADVACAIRAGRIVYDYTVR